MQSEFIHLTPSKWQEFNPPSENFVLDYLDFKRNELEIERKKQADFLRQNDHFSTFIVGVVGSVAVGKSTFAKRLQEDLKAFYPTKSIDLVTSDGFLMSNAELKEKNLMDQKGFPISFNWKALSNFLRAYKEGKENIPYRLYSQELSDLIPDKVGQIKKPDILIIEGINLLEMPTVNSLLPKDYIDLSIYLDSDKENLEYWFMHRYHKLLQMNKDNPDNFYYKWANVPIEQADSFARKVWREVNLKNLVDFIEPTKKEADLIIKKRKDHSFSDFYIRRK